MIRVGMPTSFFGHDLGDCFVAARCSDSDD
jgi:hypothetical protein